MNTLANLAGVAAAIWFSVYLFVTLDQFWLGIAMLFVVALLLTTTIFIAIPEDLALARGKVVKE